MNGNLVLATARGIWRTAWPPPAGEAAMSALTVDAPRESIAALGAAGNFACALAEAGRVFIWDGGAMMWRETARWPVPDREPVTVLPLADGRVLVGTRPAAVWMLAAGEAWGELGRLGPGPAAAAGPALDGESASRVSSLCEDGEGGLLAAVTPGGLWRWDGHEWRGVAPAGEPGGLPRDVQAVGRDPGLEGGFWVATGEGPFHLASPDGPAARRQVPAAAAVLSLRTGQRGLPAAALAAAGSAVAGPLWQEAAGVEFDGTHLLLATHAGELWRLPLQGPRPRTPWLVDLPRLRGMALLDEEEAGGGAATQAPG
jgi:hypothetical protein